MHFFSSTINDSACVGLDDFSFDNAGPLVPDFALTTTTPNVTVPDGQSSSAGFLLHRFGGSVGRIDLTFSALPTGVTASFSPGPTTASDGSPISMICHISLIRARNS